MSHGISRMTDLVDYVTILNCQLTGLAGVFCTKCAHVLPALRDTDAMSSSAQPSPTARMIPVECRFQTSQLTIDCCAGWCHTREESGCNQLNKPALVSDVNENAKHAGQEGCTCEHHY